MSPNRDARGSARSFKFPGGSDSKASASNVGDSVLVPGSGRSPGAGNGNRLQYSCLENSMDGGARWAAVHGNHKESDTTEQLHFSLHFHSRGPGTHLPAGSGFPGLQSSDLAAGGPSCLCVCSPLINNRLNLPFGAQGRFRELEPVPYKREMGGTERLVQPGALQGPARFHHQRRVDTHLGRG